MRKCKNWLETYLKYTEQSESPDGYHLWSGISALAATIRRQTWFHMGYFNVYPNMFIVLVGPAGARKTVAIRIATALLEPYEEIKVSADSTTREALIKGMNEAKLPMQVNGGEIYIHSSLTIVSEELSVFLGTHNHDLLSLLTTLYDCKNKWTYKTKTSGTDNIEGVWLNIIGATTPDWLVGSIPLTAIGGGFTSRIIFVVEDGPRKRTALPAMTPAEKQLKMDLVNDIGIIKDLYGEFKMSPSGSTWFTNWYNTRDEALAKDPRFAGYAERKHIHLLKLSMILSLAESNSLIMEDNHMIKALSLIDGLEERMVNAFGSTGRNILAQDIDSVLIDINKHGKISREQLLRHMWRDVNPKDIDIVIKTLQEMNQIKIIFEGNKIYYAKI